MRQIVVLFTIVLIITGCGTTERYRVLNDGKTQRICRTDATCEPPADQPVQPASKNAAPARNQPTGGCSPQPADVYCPSGYVWDATPQGCTCTVVCSRRVTDPKPAANQDHKEQLEIILDLSAPMKPHFALLRDALRCALQAVVLEEKPPRYFSTALTTARTTEIFAREEARNGRERVELASWVERNLDRRFVATSDPEAPDFLLVHRLLAIMKEKRTIPTKLVVVGGDALSYNEAFLVKPFLLGGPMYEAPLQGISVKVIVISKDGQCAESRVRNEKNRYVGELSVHFQATCVGHQDLGRELRSVLEGS
ncbi:hypothetical protein HY477_01440 [Candidatus Uhrbacteria bacterium]|nr:hypothetical protein [Candidatus Uhrbacteria bacterium]